MEKFAARARAYIYTYHHLFEEQQRTRQQDQTHDIIATSLKTDEDQGLLHSKIQRLTKLFKSHRRALDFDRGFVSGALKEAKLRKEDDAV